MPHGLSVDGQSHDVHMFLKHRMLDRDGRGDDGDALIGAIQAAVTPTEGGSTDIALVAEDVQVVVGRIEEQQEIAAGNEPRWKKIAHGILDMPADAIQLTNGTTGGGTRRCTSRCPTARMSWTGRFVYQTDDLGGVTTA